MQEQQDMARRKQLRSRQSHTSSSTSSSRSPSPSEPLSPSVTQAARAAHSPGQTLAAARASLRGATSSLDQPASSPAVSAAASASPAPAEAAAALPAVAVLLQPVHGRANTLGASGAVSASSTAAAAESSDGPEPDQDHLASAACGIEDDPVARQAVESLMLEHPAGSPSDADPTRSQQRTARSGSEAHAVPQPTGVSLPVSVPGSWLQSCPQQPVASCQPLVGMSPATSHQTSHVSAGHASVVSAVKPHPTTAFAKPGSHQSVIWSPPAVVHQYSANAVAPHSLDCAEDTDEDIGNECVLHGLFNMKK